MESVKQLSLFLENRAGAISAPLKILQENNINIRTLSLADTRQFGVLRLLVDSPEEARKVLESAGFVVHMTDVLALCVPDRVGGMAEVMSLLDKHHLAVEYLYAFSARCQGKAVIVFRFDDPESARKALAEEPIEFLTPSALD